MSNNNNNRKSAASWIGLLFSFVGMAGLVLSILSLLPLNSYNLYTTLVTLQQLTLFELNRTHQDDWWQLEPSVDAQLYISFLCISFISSLIVIINTMVACCRHQAQTEKHNHDGKYEKIIQRKSWFVRLTCLTLLIQITASLFGTHLIYRVKSDVEVIPMEIQYSAFISCAILWINYLSIVLFSVVLLLASFFILIGAYKSQPNTSSPAQDLNDETRPLMIV